MGSSKADELGPDLRAGVALDRFAASGMLAGQVDGAPVLLVRRGDEVLAVDGACTHYGGPLVDGLVVGDTVRCPWHHARFSLRTGAVLGAPALQPLGTWETRTEAGRVRVVGREPDRDRPRRTVAGPQPSTVAIVGAGAAGSSAARTLREEGYEGELLLIDPDPDAPYDRPNLSKDFLAGTAPAEWLPLWPADFCDRNRIERIVARVTTVDAGSRTIELSDGSVRTYDSLLIATGSSPVVPPIPGRELPHVRVLRTLADSRALLATAPAASVVIAGASFIGLEAAAALRARGLSVTVVAPEAVPFARILGEEIGTALKSLHEQHGVVFRLGRTIARIEPGRVELDDGRFETADVVLLGVGVRPLVGLTEAAASSGIEVDAQLQTHTPGIFAAGDVARYPDPRSGERIRIEHWVVAERQGATVARNILGCGEPFLDVPFFWTQQYDFTLSYVGHASSWDDAVVDGDITARDCRITYLREDEVVAVATVGRDRESLRAELALATESHPSFTATGTEV